MANTSDLNNLHRKYGNTASVSHIGGEYRTTNGLHVMEFALDLTTVGTSATIIDDVSIFPKNMRIQEVEVVCHTAADSTSDTATLNLGFIALDRSTEVDFDGLLATYDQSRMDAAGEKNTVILAGTDAGAKIGASLTSPAYVCADWDTEAFTAGVVIIRIRYYAVA